MSIPRSEYPRPQFKRDDFLILNGVWTYEFDFLEEGKEKKWFLSSGFTNKILVPFPPESKLSGVEYKDFINSIWYHRKIIVPKKWKNKKIILHFGAVDYECFLYIDGNFVGYHLGGCSSFQFDITSFVKFEKEQNLILWVKDDPKSTVQPSGKQSSKINSYECYYTRVTGIWQTVWLEAVSEFGLKECQIIPDFDNKKMILIPQYYNIQRDYRLNIKVFKNNEKEVFYENILLNNGIPISIPFSSEVIPWSCENPFLYDIILEVKDKDNKIIDKVKTYTGIRKIHIAKNEIFLNNEPIYLRFVLLQGYYPDGIWSAPTDEDLKNDIILSQKAGFNGGRLHQKVFEERFHFWADKLGFLTWAEFPSWGIDITNPEAHRNFLTELSEVIVRDRNHPSIIAWVPFNETYYKDKKCSVEQKFVQRKSYDFCKNLDPTRPVNDASGYVHIKTDIWSSHIYDQDSEELEKKLNENVFVNFPELECKYEGQPYFVDEFGGTRFINKSQNDKGWGYGDACKSKEEFYSRIERLVNCILRCKYIKGYCYTQLTDVEQEKNGLYTYDRKGKFDIKRIRKIFSKNPY